MLGSNQYQPAIPVAITGISTNTKPRVVKRLTQAPPSILTKVKIQTIAIQAIPAGIGWFNTGKKVER